MVTQNSFKVRTVNNFLNNMIAILDNYFPCTFNLFDGVNYLSGRDNEAAISNVPEWSLKKVIRFCSLRPTLNFVNKFLCWIFPVNKLI